ncbi:transcription factor bHLH149-like [Wolffia australiana]
MEAKLGRQRWRSCRQKLSYTAELVRALRRVRGASGSSSLRKSSWEVREAADRALAALAGGRSRWGAAILARRRRHGRRRWPSAPLEMARKLKMLGRLVPGCSELPLSALLEETSDYIAALEMQVQAMKALARSISSVDASL